MEQMTMIDITQTNSKSQDKTMPDLANFITTQEAADDLGFHINHIRRMIRRGDLETMRVGHMLFVSKGSIKQYKESTKGYDKHSPLKREKLNIK
jgi:excisionase family DNA binding protein